MPDGASGGIPGPELSGARAELSITDDVSFIGGLSHLPADLHIDSGIDLSALLGKRAHRPRGDTCLARAARGDAPLYTPIVHAPLYTPTVHTPLCHCTRDRSDAPHDLTIRHNFTTSSGLEVVTPCTHFEPPLGSDEPHTTLDL